MQYLSKQPFTVKTGQRKPENCAHGWTDTKGRCVMCGEPVKKKKLARRNARR